MSRGESTKSKGEGRIAGYETADFSIVKGTTQNTQRNMNQGNTPPTYRTNDKNQSSKKVGKRVGIGLLILFITVIAAFAFISNYSDRSYREMEIITPESAKYKPNTFTQKHLDNQYARDEQIGELLKTGWTISDGARKSSSYVVVGKKWESIRTNESTILNVRTSFEYNPDEQDYETYTLKINLQEIKKNGGITLDPIVINILKLYNSSINIDTINKYVQDAYNADVSSKSYEGSFSYDKDRVYVSSNKNEQLRTVAIEVNSQVSSKY